MTKIQNFFLKMIETEMNIIKETKRRSKGKYICSTKKRAIEVREPSSYMNNIFSQKSGCNAIGEIIRQFLKIEKTTYTRC